MMMEEVTEELTRVEIPGITWTCVEMDNKVQHACWTDQVQQPAKHRKMFTTNKAPNGNNTNRRANKEKQIIVRQLKLFPTGHRQQQNESFKPNLRQILFLNKIFPQQVLKIKQKIIQTAILTFNSELPASECILLKAHEGDWGFLFKKVGNVSPPGVTTQNDMPCNRRHQLLHVGKKKAMQPAWCMVSEDWLASTTLTFAHAYYGLVGY